MKAKEKNYSIIIVTGATSTNKEFVVSSKLIKNAIVAFVVLTAIFGYIIFDYLTISFNKEKMIRLENDYGKKERTISELSDGLKAIEAKLQKMAIYKDRISVAMGLTSPNALQDVGIGGPLDINPGNIQMTSPQEVQIPPFEEQPITDENILNRVKDVRQSTKNIEDTLKFVEVVMEKQKVRLASTPAIWPTKGYLTSPFGWRIHPLTGKRSEHSGQDIATQYGNKIIAPADGVVLVSENRDYYGKLLIIDHNFGYTTRYGHLATFNVKEGDRVKRGQVIGFVGNSGRSSAPHLHYEVRYNDKPQNPMNFIID